MLRRRRKSSAEGAELNCYFACLRTMNAEEYKTICSRPDAFQRSVLEATEHALSLRHPPSALRVREVLTVTPILKPKLHEGGEHTDCFLITLNAVEAEQIVEYLVDAEADAVGLEGETTSEASRFAGLVNAWVQYVDFCDAGVN